MDPDIVRDFVSVLFNDNKHYHLNPDLIPDLNEIVLCSTCAKNPLDHPFSLASGHDYGRLSKFPNISGVTLRSILPVQIYNIDILVKANHAKGHCICFPSNGPVESAKELPCIDLERIPRLTFLGPQDRWRKEEGRWSHLCEFDYEDAHEALRILVALKNPAFEGITIINSAEKRASLEKILRELKEEALTVIDDETAVGISNAAEDGEDPEGGCFARQKPSDGSGGYGKTNPQFCSMTTSTIT
jgi:hypothetical protein